MLPPWGEGAIVTDRTRTPGRRKAALRPWTSTVKLVGGSSVPKEVKSKVNALALPILECTIKSLANHDSTDSSRFYRFMTDISTILHLNMHLAERYLLN